ncbi:MAG: hypothetical protein ABL927_15400 [Bdellovibrionales bacterium]
MMLRKIIPVALIAILVSCGSEEKNVEPQNDSTQTIPATTVDCNELEKEVANLKEEIASLKKQLKKNSNVKSPTTQTTKSKSASKPVIGKTKSVVGKRDSDGSIRCSVVTNGQRCMHRTFSKNGLCQRHGGDEPVGQ